jgi:uncharacterized protein YjbI with pentapeptide repeats
MAKSRDLGRRIAPFGLQLLVAAVAVALLAACVFVLPRLLVPDQVGPADGVTTLDRLRIANERVKLQNDARTSLLQAVGGAFFLFTALLTWRQLHINREGQLTDRFSRAIDHLGSESKLDVRLGGIYALERIANDSKAERGPIIEILTAYVRGHAARPVVEPGSHAGANARPDDAAALSRLEPLAIRAADVQAVMTVLGRRRVRVGDGEILQLPGVDLRKAALSEAELGSANLSGTDLSGADLQHASLRGANLEQADLRGAALVRADLDRADLRGANFRGANLQGTILTRANLADANLGEVILEGAKLEGANLQEANLWEARLDGADLSRANLAGSTLVRADLAAATLTGAALMGATLTGAVLQRTSLTGARADRRTTWPQGFDWAAAGVLSEDR